MGGQARHAPLRRLVRRRLRHARARVSGARTDMTTMYYGEGTTIARVHLLSAIKRVSTKPRGGWNNETERRRIAGASRCGESADSPHKNAKCERERRGTRLNPIKMDLKYIEY